MYKVWYTSKEVTKNFSGVLLNRDDLTNVYAFDFIKPKHLNLIKIKK